MFEFSEQINIWIWIFKRFSEISEQHVVNRLNSVKLAFCYLINGDYSQGASGFFIENGKITYPIIHEITIASNLKDMFSDLVVAEDLTSDWK